MLTSGLWKSDCAYVEEGFVNVVFFDGIWEFPRHFRVRVMVGLDARVVDARVIAFEGLRACSEVL